MAQNTNNSVKVISRETIKPSSPTPLHLQKMKLSYLDRMMNHIYVSPIFFFQPHVDDHEPKTITSQSLKESLSQTLTSFYPIAGKIQDDHIVDCNDCGVEFIDARVHAQLKDSIQDPDVEALKQYLPPTPTNDSIFLVQFNYFDCGGIALGMLFSHRIADFASIMAFIKAWAETTTSEINERVLISPKFDLSNYFPSREFSSSEGSMFNFFSTVGNYTTKRLVFDKEKLLALQKLHVVDDDHVNKEEMVRRPTRVELVSAFIWKNIMQAANVKNTAFIAFHSVNLRPRKSPPQLLQNVFGNCFMSTHAVSDSTEKFPQLVRKLRNAFRKIDDDYISGSQSGDVYLNDLYSVKPLIKNGETGYVGFSSWCGFPTYDVDFGWGNPTWVCTTPHMNTVILVQSKCGEGIEAWTTMEQHNFDFLAAKLKLI